jgi:hypothetical protein
LQSFYSTVEAVGRVRGAPSAISATYRYARSRWSPTAACSISTAPRRRFRLASVHPGHSVAEAIDNTGFDFDRPADVPTTPAPSADTLHMMRIVVGPMLADVYPQFAKSVFGASIPCP